jgi:hypothetical protein
MRTSFTLALPILLGACEGRPPAAVPAGSPAPVVTAVAAEQLAPAHVTDKPQAAVLGDVSGGVGALVRGQRRPYAEIDPARQAGVLGDVSGAVRALLRRQRRPYAEIDPARCVLEADDAGASSVLHCLKRGTCDVDGRRTFVATILVEDSGLRLLKLEERRVDDGSCGCL